jgi:trans-2,3-dihydro-3-hydroxyanthranilate isomerase
VLRYFQVDVFAPRPFSGNGLGVFPEAASLSAAQMQTLTQELRQFESVFLAPAEERTTRARIFTVEEELPFAGHPLLGAGAVLHHLAGAQGDYSTLLQLAGGRRLEVRSSRTGDSFLVEMEQGCTAFGPPLEVAALPEALGLRAADLHTELPVQVVSTGLPYLLLPLRQGLERARVLHRDLEGLLSSLGAKFVYLLDVGAREGRTWDNRGAVEDVATGSAAGPAAAYLVQHGQARPGEWVTLAQGRFAGRPSALEVQVAASGDVTVRGTVHLVGEGQWLRLPSA